MSVNRDIFFRCSNWKNYTSRFCERKNGGCLLLFRIVLHVVTVVVSVRPLRSSWNRGRLQCCARGLFSRLFFCRSPGDVGFFNLLIHRPPPGSLVFLPSFYPVDSSQGPAVSRLVVSHVGFRNVWPIQVNPIPFAPGDLC